MKKTVVYILASVLLNSVPSFLHAQAPSPFSRTAYFDFYLNKILNAHYFLYACAQTEKSPAHITDSLAKRYNLAESSKEQTTVRNAITFYQSYFKGKDLTFGEGMYALKMALIETNDMQELAKRIPEQVLEQLSSFLPVYIKYYWPAQEAALRKSFTSLLPDLKRWEQPLYPKITTLLRAPWKNRNNHIELSVYAGWAGAFTSSENEKVCIVYQPDDSRHHELAGTEIILHEAAHAITDTLEYLIALKEKKYNKKIFAQTWHGILFYLTGKVLQEALAEQGISYELYMRKEKIFNGAFPIYQQALDPYIKGQISFDEAIDEVVRLSRGS